MNRRETAGLIGFILACFAVSALGGAITATSVGNWYQELQKPGFNPPDWLFAPVWTALYALMAVAGWRIWRRMPVTGGKAALTEFGIQLALNLAWSFLFFGMRSIGVALIEMVLLLVSIVLTACLFWRIDRLAGIMLSPYAAWVAFALVLNGTLWWLN